MEPKNLINWASISTVLSGRNDVVRKKNIPKKYEPEIKKAVKFWENWLNEVKQSK